MVKNGKSNNNQSGGRRGKNLVFKLSVLQAKAGMKPILTAAKYAVKTKKPVDGGEEAPVTNLINPWWNKSQGLISKHKERTYIMRLPRERALEKLSEREKLWESSENEDGLSWTVRQTPEGVPEGGEAIEVEIIQAEKPAVDLTQYRSVYHSVGSNEEGNVWWLEHRESVMSDERLSALLSSEAVDVFYVKQGEEIVGMAEVHHGSVFQRNAPSNGSFMGDSTAAAACTPELAEAVGLPWPLPKFKGSPDAFKNNPNGKDQVEIKYFGFVPAATKAGLGKLTMTWVLDRLFNGKPSSIAANVGGKGTKGGKKGGKKAVEGGQVNTVWLSTCLMDTPQAKPFYESCGFKQEHTWETEMFDPRATGIYPPDSRHWRDGEDGFFFWAPVKGKVASKVVAVVSEMVSRKVYHWKKNLLGKSVKKARSHSLQQLRRSVKRLQEGANEGAEDAKKNPDDAEKQKTAAQLAETAAARAKDSEDLIAAKLEDLIDDAWAFYRRGRVSVDDVLEDARTAGKLVKVEGVEHASRWKKLLWSQSGVRKGWKSVEEAAEKLFKTLDRSAGVSVAKKAAPTSAGAGDEDMMFGEDDDEGGSGGSSDEGAPGPARGRKADLASDEAYWNRELAGKTHAEIGDDIGMKKKNRMGQRERQRLAEARFGRSAKHLRGETRRAFYGGLKPVNAKGTKAAQKGGEGEGDGEEYEEMEYESYDKPTAASGNGSRRVVGEKRKATPESSDKGSKKAKTNDGGAGGEEEKLHPSWAAKRAAAAKAAVVFEGTKKKFDLSDDDD